MGFASIHLIPLADAATVIFTSPVFVSIFACLCLGEVCSWFDISIIALTLIGVLLVSKPSFNFINTGTWTGSGAPFVPSQPLCSPRWHLLFCDN
ncbi:Solute carrier family 35 member G1 [Orchesella cincta]|uniref:Solute carrier family 35 member G1 n=1 Tax=Orchesella cincta TaxID=48709 RepID=A0A1D2N4V2_ORCCI|nr:Solute carrier family 35 member G1 [Orchesella cincta]